MYSDEELARQLQAQEEAAAAQHRAAAAHHLRGSNAGQTRVLSQLNDAMHKAQGYEDELAQAMALSVMPLDRLMAAAEEACAVSVSMGEQPPLAREDALAQELLLWFKQDFFTWVNAPPCDKCGSTTGSAGMAQPLPQEAAHQAGRVELYRCTSGLCGALSRFPRYNDPVKLLETRRGRCGEWANAFTLCCRAAGLDARLAVDFEDHVWTEQWSEAQQKWIHLDPCEAACDKPLLYEAGWGKRLSYVLAVGRDGVADVTRRYTARYDEVLGRRALVPEAWLEGCLHTTTARLRAPLPAAERQRLEVRDALDVQHMLSSAAAAALAGAELAALPARTTGDAAWLAARGEDGREGAAAAQQAGPGVVAAAAASAREAGGGTRYRLAKDEQLAAAQPLRLFGGAVRASGENVPGEAASHAFDGQPHTKWLDFGGKACNAAWLEYLLPAEQPPAVLGSYALTSANDSPERDPRHVLLQAWSEEAGAWVTLDEQADLRFPARHHRLHLQLGPTSSRSSSSGSSGGSSGSQQAPASCRFRLWVVSVADPAAANSVQLACLDLYRCQPQQAAQQAQQAQQAGAGFGGGQEQTAAAVAVGAGASEAAGTAQEEHGRETDADLQAEQRLAGLNLEPSPPAPPLPPAPQLPPPSLVPQPPVASGSAVPGPQVGVEDNPWAALFKAS